MKFKNDTIRFSIVYFPPNLSECYEKQLKSDLNEIVNIKYDIFIIGDFNKPNIDWQNPDLHHSHLAQFCIENGLTQVIHENTREKHILDLLFCSNPLLLNNIVIQEPFLSSDHNSITFDIFIENQQNFDIKVRNFLKADYNNIFSDLSLLSWYDLFAVCANVDDFWKLFSDILQKIEKYVPFREPARKKFLTPRELKQLLSKNADCGKNLS